MSSSKWPVRWRNDPIDCSLCGEPTHQQKGVCDTCKELFRYGRDQRKMYPSSEENWYYFCDEYDKHFWGNANTQVSRITSRGGYARESLNLSDIIRAFKPQEIKELSVNWETFLKIKEDKLLMGPDPFFLDTHPLSSRSVKLRKCFLLQREASLMNLVFELIPSALLEQERRGKMYGAGFIQKLAKGDLSIEQINKWHTELEEK